MRKACCYGCFKSDTQQRCRQVAATTCRACCLKHEWAVCDKPRNDLYCMCSGKDDSFVDSFSGFRGAGAGDTSARGGGTEKSPRRMKPLIR